MNAQSCYRTRSLTCGLYIIKTALSSMASVVWCLRQLFVHLLKALARLLEYHIAGAYLFLWVFDSILLSNLCATWGLYIIKTSLSSPFGAKNTGLELVTILVCYLTSCTWGCNPYPDGKRCLFFVYIPKGSYLLSNLLATLGFIYNKNFSSFTLRGKKHWARTDF